MRAGAARRVANMGQALREALLLVKPQFEVGKERVGKGGVVRDPAAHGDAIEGVIAAAALPMKLNLALAALVGISAGLLAERRPAAA